MEGDLLYYSGLIGRFKKIYGLIDGGDFVAFKGQKNSQEFQEILRIPLQPYENDKGNAEYAHVYPHSTNNQFSLTIGGSA